MLRAYDCYVNDMRLVELVCGSYVALGACELRGVNFVCIGIYIVVDHLKYGVVMYGTSTGLLSNLRAHQLYVDLFEYHFKVCFEQRGKYGISRPPENDLTLNIYTAEETKIPQPLPITPSPVPPSDDPYLIVRQAHTHAAIDIESEPEEAPLETGELQPLAARTTSPPSDHTPTLPDATLVSPLIDEEFEAYEPSNNRITSSHSTAPSDFTTPLSPDHPLTQTTFPPTLSRPLYYRRTARMVMRTQPAMSHGLSSKVTEAMELSPSSFRKRYRSSYETPSPSSSPTLPLRKRYQGTSELVEHTEDESLDSNTEREGSRRATVTFSAIWRLVLDLESWARHVDAKRRELQELQDRVTTLEQEGSRKGQLRFEEHCVLTQKCCGLILSFAIEESCVLLKKNLAFCSKNIAFCLNSQMHNNIMAAGSRDRQPMLAPGRYPQWRSRFLRYVDTRPNSKALRKCILSGPYKPSTVLVHAVEATDNSPAVAEHNT
nr:hypothetical protein [Tanacetum cinerariifolium]